MKQKMRNMIIPSVAALVFFATGCGWTEPEHIRYYRQTPEEADPEGYEAYLQDLRAYKQTEHKVMIIGTEGTSGYPVLQNQHLMSLPDSADYIYVRNAENLHSVIVDEIREVKEKKGTRVLSYVDFALADEDWLQYKNEKMDNGEPLPTLDECKTFFKTHAKKQLASCEKYGFEGVVVSYIGSIIEDEARISQEGFMSAVKEWTSLNPDLLLIIRGNFNNISDTKLLAGSRYLMIVLGGISGVPNYKSELRNIFYKEAIHPYRDRIVFEVTVPSSEEPVQKGDSPRSAAKNILSEAIISYEPYKILGLSVSNAHDDYYNDYYTVIESGEEKKINVGNYANVRPGITVLNPIGQ